ncbi:hypothetical protein D9615_007552 [Tricholomella constricta]|uniref:Uncharacterized protein n=1 Tax=Tricholomella constricta TaxID=117010 RepID=A0A8H5M2A3_9AGAR|nr:hypothetical protein D9615_007552 [Tricholomella constricta]
MSDPSPIRKRTASGSSNATADNLPPPRTSKAMKPVSAPLTHTRLHRLIYLLILLTTLLTAYYSYRVVQYKTEVGGWWNLALGRRPPQLQTQQPLQEQGSGTGFSKGRGRPGKPKVRCEEESVEERINSLARALGMPSKDLASAIAVAVREYVPPASLSSVAAHETGPAVQAMLKGAGYEHVKVKGAAADSQSTGVVSGVVGGMESFVGMDEP